MILQIQNFECNTNPIRDEVEVQITGRANRKEMYEQHIYDDACRYRMLNITSASRIPAFTKTVRLDWFTGIDNLKIKKVVYNEPATIVYWDDGTKTVVKCQDGDIYDKEKGLALCYMKKITGNKSGIFNKVLKEWLK